MPWSKPRQLTKGEREERAANQRRQDAQGVARATHQVAEALRANVQREAVLADAAVEIPQDLPTAFAHSVEDGRAELETRLREAGLAYDIDRLTTEYIRTLDGYARALRRFHPIVPLNGSDLSALIHALQTIPANAVDELVEDALRARALRENNATRWLQGWVRNQRGIPEDGDAADRHDSQAAIAAHPVKRGDRDTFRVRESYIEGTDMLTGQPRRVSTIEYDIPSEDEED